MFKWKYYFKNALLMLPPHRLGMPLFGLRGILRCRISLNLRKVIPLNTFLFVFTHVSRRIANDDFIKLDIFNKNNVTASEFITFTFLLWFFFGNNYPSFAKDFCV